MVLGDTRFFIRNQFIRNLHAESRKIKKLLELHYMTIFQIRNFFHTYLHFFFLWQKL